MSDACITCGDVALPLTVVELIADGVARCVAPDGGTEDVATDLVGELTVGDIVLVHAKVALTVLAPESVATEGGGP